MKKQSFIILLACSIILSILFVFSCSKKDEHLANDCTADLPRGELKFKLDEFDLKQDYRFGNAEYKNDKYTYGISNPSNKNFIDIYQNYKSSEMPNIDKVFAIAMYLESIILEANTEIDKEKISAIGVYYLTEGNKAVHSLFEAKNGFVHLNKWDFTVSGVVSNVATYLLYNEVKTPSPKCFILMMNKDFDLDKIIWQDEDMQKFIIRHKTGALNNRAGEPCGPGCTVNFPDAYCMVKPWANTCEHPVDTKCTDPQFMTLIEENELMGLDTASAAFDLELHYDFRDDFLMQYDKGVQYVNFYYNLSDMIV